MTRMINVLIVNPDIPPYVDTREATLQMMQDHVGGYIEMIPWFGNVHLVANEDGKLEKLPMNRMLDGDWTVGNLMFVATDRKGELASLTEKDITRLKKLVTPMIIKSAPVEW